jgi:hypothetical protein
LKVLRADAHARIEELAQQLDQLRSNTGAVRSESALSECEARRRELIDEMIVEARVMFEQPEEIEIKARRRLRPSVAYGPVGFAKEVEWAVDALRYDAEILSAMRLRVDAAEEPSPLKPPIDPIIQIVDGFHASTQPLRTRRKGKPTIDFTDEYDVQDLLHSLLLVPFETVVPEEWAPKRAGSNKRVDLVLPDLRTAIEAKFVRDRDHAKKVFDEITVDLEHYAQLGNVDRLVAVVYDPDAHVASPGQAERQLSGERIIQGKKLVVDVFVRPRRR